jgi:hypothetical protein
MGEVNVQICDGKKIFMQARQRNTPEDNFTWRPIQVRSGNREGHPRQVQVEQREEPLLEKYKDSSRLRSSALHGGLAKCFNNEVNGA